MTVAATSRVAGPFNGDGAQVNFDFTFKIFATSDVVVTHTTAAGVESTKVLNTDYTVAMNADQDVTPGGRVTMVVPPLGGGTPEKITLSSNVPESQGTSLPTGSGWQAKVVEKALDKATILVGQLRALLTRIPKYPISDGTTAKDLPTKTARANLFLGFDANGDPIAASSPSGGTVSAAMASVVSAVSVIAARLALGFSAIAAKGDLFAGTAANTIGTLTVGADGTGLVYIDNPSRPNLLINPNWQIDQINEGALYTINGGRSAGRTAGAAARSAPASSSCARSPTRTTRR
jgi:hypothetical protein